ncbi:MAG: hypothetical protein V4549_06475 [Bacteroidota bacterium]
MKQVFAEQREAEAMQSLYMDDSYYYENWKASEEKKQIKTKNNNGNKEIESHKD